MQEVKIYRDRGEVNVSYISGFENRYAMSFPVEYKELLTKHNALRLEKDHFNYNLNGERRAADISFLGYGPSIDDYLCIDRLQQDNEYPDKGLIVFGETAGGDYVCFDYRLVPDTKSPPVVIMLHDYLDADNNMVVCDVASDFASFMDYLYEYKID